MLYSYNLSLTSHSERRIMALQQNTGIKPQARIYTDFPFLFPLKNNVYHILLSISICHPIVCILTFQFFL